MPSLIVASSFIFFLVNLLPTLQFLVVFLGTLISWIYLRFFKVVELQQQQDGGAAAVLMRGDRSETFSFASFLPEVLHPFIHPVSNSSYAFLVSLKLCPAISTSSSSYQYSMVGGVGGAVPAGTDIESPVEPTSKSAFSADVADAERRRALALRALDMRLAEKKAAAKSAIPTSASAFKSATTTTTSTTTTTAAAPMTQVNKPVTSTTTTVTTTTSTTAAANPPPTLLINTTSNTATAAAPTVQAVTGTVNPAGSLSRGGSPDRGTSTAPTTQERGDGR
ncbi:hypothetical protein HK102_000475 [Quaeritorhiza haematococci]|nr:hypothetical protein HK102_000475 [Quaeritorhiza haematococci]